MTVVEGGERYPQTSAEHADESRRLLRMAEHDLTEALLSFEPAKIQAATASYAGKVAAAQVHATLALVPDPLEAVLTEQLAGVLDAQINEGTRVVFVQERPGRRHLILAADSIGTVQGLGFSDGDFPTAQVEWDDGVTEWAKIAGLRVVLGA